MKVIDFDNIKSKKHETDNILIKRLEYRLSKLKDSYYNEKTLDFVLLMGQITLDLAKLAYNNCLRLDLCIIHAINESEKKTKKDVSST